MDDIPRFTANENLDRVLMDENTKHLIVEGPMDLPIYYELVELLCNINDIEEPPIVVYGGGKKNILNFLQAEDIDNTNVILDMDFDNPDEGYGFDNVYSLKKYSIENYAFDEAVIVNLVSNLLTANPDDVRGVLSLNEMREHWFDSLSNIIPVVYYYQKEFEGDKSKWTNIFINEGGGDWKLSAARLERFKDGLLTEMDISQAECEEAYAGSFCTGVCPSVAFPGKILFESFHRYLKDYCNSQRASSYSTINSKKTLLLQLTSRLIKNPELEGILLNVVA
ncbi:MAG: hypothetical protein ACI8O8_003218 [Oleiphilaceae bacterium]|jgi:hypothetical protein